MPTAADKSGRGRQRKRARRVTFSEAVLNRLTPPAKGRVYYYDTKTPGLVLSVSARNPASGQSAKSFLLYKWMNRRPIKYTLGRWPAVTVEWARKEAQRRCGQIAGGSNPADARRKARTEWTLTDLWAAYFEKHSKPRKRSWREDERQWKAYFAPLQHRLLSEIRIADVRDWHSNAGRKHGPYQANRAMGLLSSMYAFAVQEGFEGANPCRGVRRFPEVSRNRFLLPDEVGKLFRALEAEPAPWGDFFKVLLLTGARIGNLQAAKWADLELERGLWRVAGEESKSGDPLVMVLTGPVVVILRSLAATAGTLPQEEQSEYVFPAARGDGHVAYPQKQWARVRTTAGLKDVRPHDLRRSLASYAVGAGVSIYNVSKALGHRDIGTTQIYARLDLTPIQQAIGAGGAAILAAAGRPLALPAGGNDVQTEGKT